MGTFHVDCAVINHVHRNRRVEAHRILVDTGSEYTWISANILKKIGVLSEKKDVEFILANGQYNTWEKLERIT